MKKAALILIVASLLTGCGPLAEKAEIWQHDTMYKNWDHTFYSVYGYKASSEETLEKTREQNWWGLPQAVPIDDTNRDKKIN